MSRSSNYEIKDGLIYCDRCLRYWLPQKMTNLLIKEPDKVQKRLKLCPKCMAVINASLYLKHKT